MITPWRKVGIAVLYVLVAAGVVAPLWAAGIVEVGVGTYGVDHISSFGPVIPVFSRNFQEHIAWFTVGPKFLAGVGVLAAIAVHKFQKDIRSRLVGLLAISVLGYHLALMLVATFLLAFFLLPRAANGI